MQSYELVAILDPRMDAGQAAAAVAKIDNVLVTGDGELLASEEWGVRRLAYPIKQLREGNYILRKMKLPSSEAVSLNQMLRMSEEVLRHLIVKIEDIVTTDNEVTTEDIVTTDNDLKKS